MRRFLVALGSAVLLAIAGGFALGLLDARADPIVRRVTIALPGWPAGAAPVRVVLMSDIHIGSAAMGPRRLARIVGQVNALRPDLVLIAGDFIYGHAPDGAVRLGEVMVAPLSRLRAPLGVLAAPGNHDHWTGLAAVTDQLRRAHVTLVANGAIRRGPLAIGVIDDDFSDHANVPATLAALRSLPGAKLLLTHSPDIAAALPADAPALLLAGHTHCGQVVLPLYGPVSDISRYGSRYRCGLRREGSRTVIVTAGLGTSGPPLRFGAPPDLWLLTLGPAKFRAISTRPSTSSGRTR